MKLDLRFSNRPLEDLWCQAVTALVFQEADITDESILGLNTKMGGFLSHLKESGFWTGERGERLLVAPQDMIPSDKVLFYGLGRRSGYKISIVEQGVQELGKAFRDMRVNEFGIAIPIVETPHKDYPSLLEIAIQYLVKPFYEHHNHDLNFILKIIVFIERDFIERLYLVVDRLRLYFSALMEVSIIVDRKTNDTQVVNDG
ncbi:MAG: hypothetical protein JW932_20175 [Deltaproteobacteria bacterium]|nr:hypothetical protein [Deltaproteobacteria bacterium]